MADNKNPFTTAQAANGMGMLAPDLAMQQTQLTRQQELANLLRKQALEPIGDTQVIGGWAVKRSPLEGISKMAQALMAGKMQNDADQQQVSLSKAIMQSMLERNGGLAKAPDQLSPEQYAMALGSKSTGQNGPTLAAAQNLDDIKAGNIQMPPQQAPDYRTDSNPLGLKPGQATYLQLTAPDAYNEMLAKSFAPTDKRKDAEYAANGNIPRAQAVMGGEQINKNGGMLFNSDNTVSAPNGFFDFERNKKSAETPYDIKQMQSLDKNGYVTTAPYAFNPMSGGMTPINGFNPIPIQTIHGQTAAGDLGVPVKRKKDAPAPASPRPNSNTPAQNSFIPSAQGGKIVPPILPPSAGGGGMPSIGRGILPQENKVFATKMALIKGQLQAELDKSNAQDNQKYANDKLAEYAKGSENNAQIIANASHIENLAHMAITGEFSSNLSKVNTIFAAMGIKPAKTAQEATDTMKKEMQKLANAMPSSSDSQRYANEAASPNIKMNPNSIIEASRGASGKAAMEQARVQFLLPYRGEPDIFRKKEQEFNLNADPDAFRLSLYRSDPSEIARAKSKTLHKKLEWMKDNGVIK